MSHGPIFIIGAGPGIGSHVASVFATHSFTHLALIARSEITLSSSKDFITSGTSTAAIHTYSADVADSGALTTALETACQDLGGPEVIIYNAARMRYGTMDGYSDEDVVEDYKVPVLGLRTTAHVLLPKLRSYATIHPEAHPSLFVTSGVIIHQPFAPVFSLGMAKAAQAHLVSLLAAAPENKDVVHVALVTVGGPVSMEAEIDNPVNIAERFWELFCQRKGEWALEMESGR